MKNIPAKVNFRPMLLICIGICAGILCASLKSISVLFLIMAAAGIIISVILRKKAAVLLCIAFLLGFLRILSISSVPANFPGNNHVIRGTVLRADGNATVLTALYIDKKPVDGDMIIRKNIGFICGDRVRLISRITRNISYSEKSKDAKLLYAADEPEETVKVGEKAGLLRGIAQAREYVKYKTDIIFGEYSSIVKAVLFGDTSFLDKSELASYRTAGIAHIFALSGLHVGIIAFALEKVLFFADKRARKCIVSAFVTFYMLFVGVPISFARAVIMYIVSTAAFLLCRRYDSMSAFSFAACIVLGVNPYALYSASFILSFGAVLSIILLMNPVHRAIFKAEDTRLSRYGALTLSTSVGIIPFTAAIFGSFSIYAFFVNLVCIPLASLAVIFAFSAAVLGLVFIPLALPFAFCAKILFEPVRVISEVAAMLPFASLKVGQ